MTDLRQNSWSKGSRLRLNSILNLTELLVLLRVCVCAYWECLGSEVPVCYVGTNIFLSLFYPAENHGPSMEIADTFSWCMLAYFHLCLMIIYHINALGMRPEVDAEIIKIIPVMVRLFSDFECFHVPSVGNFCYSVLQCRC